MFHKCVSCGTPADLLAVGDVVKFAKESGAGRLSLVVGNLVAIHVIMEKDLAEKVQAVIDEYDAESERFEIPVE